MDILHEAPNLLQRYRYGDVFRQYVQRRRPLVAAAALEPDSPGSYLGVCVIPMGDGESQAPVYRVMADPPACLRP